jgi:hypothetical protein
MPSLSSPVIPDMENNAGNLIEDSFPDAKRPIDDEDPIKESTNQLKSNLSIEDGKNLQTPRESDLSSDDTDPEERQIPPGSNILCDSEDPELASNLIRSDVEGPEEPQIQRETDLPSGFRDPHGRQIQPGLNLTSECKDTEGPKLATQTTKPSRKRPTRDNLKDALSKNEIISGKRRK